MEINNELYAKIEKLSELGNHEADYGNYEDALKYFNDAYDLLPIPKEKWEAYIWLCASIGDMYFSLKKYDMAMDYFERSYAEDSIGNPFILLRIGEIHYELNHKKEAKEYLLRAYMLEGKEIFDGKNQKYYKWLSKNVKM